MTAPSPLLMPGTVLGRYELLVPVAQGGMAAIWAARQTGSRGFEKVVAIKTMLAHLSEDPSFEQMFLDEAALAAQIHHPNVVEVLDLGEENGVLFIAMEWIDGETVAALIKSVSPTSRSIPIRIAVKIVAEVAAGLAAAHLLADDEGHLLGIVHRDVSPQNVIVTYDGFVKVVDFGIAKIGTLGGATRTGELKGKIPYMSPEQACGAPIDLRTDIFALGTMLYRLLTGVHPFVAENDVLTLQRIAEASPAPMRELDPAIPASVERLVFRCLEKDVSARFQSMGEVGAALGELRHELGAASSEEVGAFVKQIGGDGGKARRAAIRKALKRQPDDEEIHRSFPKAPRTGFTPPSHARRRAGHAGAAVRADSTSNRHSGSTFAGNALESERSAPPSRALVGAAITAACMLAFALGAWMVFASDRSGAHVASSAAPTSVASGASVATQATAPVEAPSVPPAPAPVASAATVGSAATPYPARHAQPGRPRKLGAPGASTAKPWVQPGGAPDPGF